MDSRVTDPDLAPIVTESSDDDPPPPTALHGINLLVPGGQSISGVIRSNFHLNHEVPGLLRFRSGRNEPLEPTTPVSELRWPIEALRTNFLLLRVDCRRFGSGTTHSRTLAYMDRAGRE